MNVRKRIRALIDSTLIKTTTYLIANSLVSSFLGFIFWTLCARFYSPKSLGLAVALISGMTLLSSFSNLGFGVLMVRVLPTFKDKEKIINSSFTISGFTLLVLSTIFLLFLDSISPELGFLRESLLYSSLFILFTLFWLFTVLLESLFLSLRKARYILLKNTLFSILKIAFPFFLIFLGAMGIFVSWGLASLLAFLLSFHFYFKRLMPEYRLRLDFDFKSLKPMLSFAFGNYLAGLLSRLPVMVLPLMIINLLNPESTAYFYVSFMIASILFILPQATASSLLAEGSHNEKMISENLRNSLKFIVITLTPAIALTLVFVDFLLGLFGNRYVESGHGILILLVLSSIPLSINTLRIVLYNLEKKVGNVIKLNALISFSTLVLSYLLLGRMGLKGVGIAYLTTQTIVSLVIFFGFVKRILK